MALQKAGCIAVEMECVPAKVAAEITKRVNLLVFSMGSGPDCDGQFLFSSDLLARIWGIIHAIRSPMRGFLRRPRKPCVNIAMMSKAAHIRRRNIQSRSKMKSLSVFSRPFKPRRKGRMQNQARNLSKRRSRAILRNWARSSVATRRSSKPEIQMGQRLCIAPPGKATNRLSSSCCKRAPM